MRARDAAGKKSKRKRRKGSRAVAAQKRRESWLAAAGSMVGYRDDAQHARDMARLGEINARKAAPRRSSGGYAPGGSIPVVEP